MTMLSFVKRNAPMGQETKMKAELKTFLESLSGQITDEGLLMLCEHYDIPFHEAKLRTHTMDDAEAIEKAYDKGYDEGLRDGAAE